MRRIKASVEDWYANWLDLYCEKTGIDAEQANAQLDKVWESVHENANKLFRLLQAKELDFSREKDWATRLKSQINTVLESELLDEISLFDLESKYERLGDLEHTESKLFKKGKTKILKLQNFRIISDSVHNYIFNRLFLYNLTFPETAYTLEGICYDTSNKEFPEYKFLVSQKFIKDTTFAEDKQALEEELLKRGFVKDNKAYLNGIVRLRALPEKNVLIDNKGRYYFVDPNIDLDKNFIPK